MAHSRQSGVTFIEILTAVVALVVITAVAVPLWQTHQLRVRRADAIEALLAVQASQDRYFGAHAEYADNSRLVAAPPEGLGIQTRSKLGHYDIEVQRSADGLGYVAIAHSVNRGDEPGYTGRAQESWDNEGGPARIDPRTES